MTPRVACDHADRCGGCPLLDLSYDEQLARKRSRVVDAMARHPSLAFVTAEPVIGADPIVAYRTRAKLIVAPGPAIGLFARGGGPRVGHAPRCRVLAPALATVAAALRERVRAAEVTGGVLAPCDPGGRGALAPVAFRELQGAPPARPGVASGARAATEGVSHVLVTFV